MAKTCTCLLLFFVFCFSTVAIGTPNENSLKGAWMVEKEDAAVEISKEGGIWNGYISWLKDPLDDNPNSPNYGKPWQDDLNPVPELRKRPLIGLKILNNFKWADTYFTGGEIYDPDNGKLYKCKITFIDKDTIKVRGYIGIPWIGESEIWKRKK